MLAEYLQRGKGPVATEREIDEFTAAVQDARDAADRLDARLRRAENKK